MEDVKTILTDKAASQETQEAVMCRKLAALYRAWVKAGRPAQGN